MITGNPLWDMTVDEYFELLFRTSNAWAPKTASGQSVKVLEVF